MKSMPVLSASRFSSYHHWYKCSKKSPRVELCRKCSALWQEQNFPIISRHHLSYQCQALISGKKVTGLTSNPKALPCVSKALIFCWSFSAASPSTLSLNLHSSTGQPLGMAELSPLTQHIPRLNSDLWGQVRSPSGLSPCRSSTHCTGVGLVGVCHTKAELLQSRIVS